MSSNLRNFFTEIFEQIKKNKEMNETKLRRLFDKQNILESFGYDEDDISVEANIEGKRADYHCRDEYDNVVVVWEFKKPSVTNLSDYISQLWDLYVKPLKADYGVLFNGFQIILFRRRNSNYEEVFRKDVKDLTDEEVKKLQKIEKPDYSITKLKEIREYFDKFQPEEEKITLQEESSREHFYKIFRLTRGSVFENLLSKMVELFQREYETYQKSKFLTSAYDFWKEAYANEPDEVPKEWEGIMERLGLNSSKKEDLFKFMFCLETSYALFTRLILAKACEDYEFPGVEFSGFIERKVKDFSFRGKEISRPAWAITAKQLIERMRDQLVESIFEEDIFYWWTSAFKEIEEDIKHGPYSGKADRATVLFGEAVAKLLFAVYKFDFSKIIGDPLGNLYQRYFDKKTRKALGEFYTPQEVVDYIIDAVDYEGRQITDERLLDPACGSGTFLVTALNKYLSEAEKKVKNGSSWTKELKKLCNEYHIVGFDIHPFATIMAQIQFMLVLLEPYKKALKEDSRFVLNRIPVFRTDSLIDERKSGKVDLESFGNGETQSIKMPLKLPIYEEEEKGFVTIELVLPYKNAVIKHEVDLLNTEEYFKTLQALFDSVKKRAKNDKYTLDKEEFKTNLKHYLENKNWSQITNFLEPYGNNLLQKVKKLKYEYGDGRLVKSIEDLLLASVLKNYVNYDYVVGNPPYVRKELIDPEYKETLSETHPKVYSGDNDLSVYFIERGIKWLNKKGRFGVINTGKFLKTRYGKYLRAFILKHSTIERIIDLRSSKVFQDATNDPVIITLQKEDQEEKFSYLRVVKDLENEANERSLERTVQHIDEHFGQDYSDEYLESYSVSQKYLLSLIKRENGRLYCPSWPLIHAEGVNVLKKMKNNSSRSLEEALKVNFGIKTGNNKIYILKNKEAERIGIPNNFLKPTVKGSNIKKYKISYDGLNLLFPYEFKDIKEGEVEAINLDNYPNLRKYLTKHKESLTNRYDIKNSEVKWFELRPCSYYEIFESEKLICPDISQGSKFAYDDGKYYCLNTCYLLSPKEDTKTPLLKFLALLNSKPIDFFIRQNSVYLGPRGYRLQVQALKPIPLPDLENTPLERKVEKILSYLGGKEKIKEFPKSYLDNIEAIRKVCKMKNSSSTISPEIQQRQDDSYNIVVGKEETNQIVVNTEEKARFVKLALEGKSVKKDETIEILVPKSNKKVKKILEEYKKDKKKLEEMPSVEELEEEINQIVYNLYGLDEDDIEVIENFLEKF